MLEFDTGVLGCELPVCVGVIGIAVVFPRGDFVDEGLFVGDAAVETLSGEDAELGFRQIEPTAVLGRVVPFEALDQPPGFGGRKGLVKRRLAVDVEIVLDQHNGFGAREVTIGQIL